MDFPLKVRCKIAEDNESEQRKTNDRDDAISKVHLRCSKI